MQKQNLLSINGANEAFSRQIVLYLVFLISQSFENVRIQKTVFYLQMYL